MGEVIVLPQVLIGGLNTQAKKNSALLRQTSSS